MGRGIDRKTAATMRAGGLTLSKLKSASDAKLKGLGLSTFAISSLRQGPRSEIPFPNLAEVLIANRYQCCVCNDPEKSIIVHHIVEWAQSHNHAPANLAALCLAHHDEAHSKKELSRNLTPATLRAFKKAWEAEVRVLNVTAILDASRADSDAWLYYNHTRLFELAASFRVKLSDLEYYPMALAAGVIRDSGLPLPRLKARPYMYDGGDGIPLYLYVRDVLHAVLERLTVFNISDYLDRGLLLPLLKKGDFILLQGAHTFRRLDKAAQGATQPAEGERRVNHVDVRYFFNLWEATSSSAHGLWLRGHKSATSLIRLGKVESAPGKLTLTGTVIGIAQEFGRLKTRDYTPQMAVGRRRRNISI